MMYQLLKLLSTSNHYAILMQGPRQKKATVGPGLVLRISKQDFTHITKVTGRSVKQNFTEMLIFLLQFTLHLIESSHMTKWWKYALHFII
jgi:hypothetical protein